MLKPNQINQILKYKTKITKIQEVLNDMFQFTLDLK